MDVRPSLSKKQIVYLLRWVLIIASAYLFLFSLQTLTTPPALALLLAVALLSNLLLPYFPQRWVERPAFDVALVIFDTLWVSLGAFLTHNLSGDFFLLYFLIILLAVVGERLGVIAFGAAIIGVTYIGALALGSPSSLLATPAYLLRIPLLFAVALFYGYLVARVRQERLRADEARREAHDELERRVEERTAELSKANEMLKEQITERQQAEEQLKASLKEKEVLLKEIHHRVKNNLQIISSLLNLQSDYIHDQQALGMFKESQNRIKSMTLIHEKLYQSPDLARIEFAQYLPDLTAQLFRSYGVNPDAITLKVNVEEISLGIDTAIPCGLLISELVSNSLKHAFGVSQEGEIHIDFRRDNDNKLTLMVSDNGVGFPKDIDFRHTESLGLQLVNTLAEQLEGTLELHSQGGTTFKLTFAELKP